LEKNMGFVTWIAIALVAGLLAQLVLRGGPGGMRPRRLVLMAAVGVVGAIVGGSISGTLGFWDVSGLNVRSLIIATGGSLVVIAAWRVVWNVRKQAWAV
jgi:uncharacterized membrane protein YeaQ/YmgE (transglycosylase-associated protein family)